jgi:multidrug transporter EmrE-like cation transporter
MSTALAPILPLGVGYGVVVGIGFLFAFVMVGISMLQVTIKPSHIWRTSLIVQKE